MNPGGFQVTGPATWFDADLRLPVGATIVGASVFLNPNGGPARLVQLVRYRPLPPTFENLFSNLSSTGAAGRRQYRSF